MPRTQGGAASAAVAASAAEGYAPAAVPCTAVTLFLDGSGGDGPQAARRCDTDGVRLGGEAAADIPELGRWRWSRRRRRSEGRSRLYSNWVY